MKTVNAKSGSVIPIGRLGEHEAVAVVFGTTNWAELYGQGTFSLLVQRNGDAVPYPAQIQQTEAAVTWTVRSADVATAGYGQCELIYTVGDTIAKSEVYTTVTGKALTGGGEVPEPWEDWVQRVIEAGTQAQASAASASADADRAETSAEAAERSAQEAKQYASTATTKATEAATSEQNAFNYQQGSKEYRDETEAMLDDLVKYDNDEFASPLPFNADQLNGHPETYFAKQEDMGAAEADIARKYEKPLTGIPKADLDSGVQASLGKADTALQEHQSLSAYRTAEAQDTIDNGKQPVISDLDSIRSGASAGATAYQKPSSGIPATDMTTAVQESLGKADTALQEHQSLSAYRTAAAQDEIDAQKYSASNPPPYPVTSVNGQTGGVVLNYITFDEEES